MQTATTPQGNAEAIAQVAHEWIEARGVLGDPLNVAEFLRTAWTQVPWTLAAAEAVRSEVLS